MQTSSKIFLILTVELLTMGASGCYSKASSDALLGGSSVSSNPSTIPGYCGDSRSPCTSDSFARAASTPQQLGIGPQNKTDAGGLLIPGSQPYPYQIKGGTWGIAANNAEPLSLDASLFGTATIDTEFSNCTIDLTISTQSTGGMAGLVFRHDSFINDRNFWAVYADKTGGIFGSAGYYLYKWVAGAGSSPANAVMTVSDGDRLRVITDGGSITVLVNGAIIMSITDTALTANTQFGFQSYNDLTARFGFFDVMACH